MMRRTFSLKYPNTTRIDDRLSAEGSKVGGRIKVCTVWTRTAQCDGVVDIVVVWPLCGLTFIWLRILFRGVKQQRDAVSNFCTYTSSLYELSKISEPIRILPLASPLPLLLHRRLVLLLLLSHRFYLSVSAQNRDQVSLRGAQARMRVPSL